MDSGPVGAATAAPPPRHYCALSPGSYVSSRTREETALLLPGSKLEQFSLQEARSTRTLLPSTPQTVSWILAERVLDPRGMLLFAAGNPSESVLLAAFDAN